MKPGDLIEWAYTHSGKTVMKEEIMWSSVDKCYVPVGSDMSHMVISYYDEVLTWVNEKGVFSSYVGEVGDKSKSPLATRIFPRNFTLKERNKMCKKIRCDVCKKYTYEGCGRHVEEVLYNVPIEERCDRKCVIPPDEDD